MRRALTFAIAAAILMVASGSPAQKADSKDTIPWHLGKIAKLGVAQPGSEAANPDKDGKLKYLHLKVNYSPTVRDLRMHTFRVTDARGETVAEIYGFYRDQSLLVFEGDWASLRGLYLDGLGHREPLFAEQAVAQTRGTTVLSRESPGSTPTSGLTRWSFPIAWFATAWSLTAEWIMWSWTAPMLSFTMAAPWFTMARR